MLRFTVGGMSCAACSAKIERALGSLPGVISVEVSATTKKMRVRLEVDDGGIVEDEASFNSEEKRQRIRGARDIVKLLDGMGFPTKALASGAETDPEAMKRARLEEVSRWRRLFSVSLFFAIPMFVFHSVLAGYTALDAPLGKFLALKKEKSPVVPRSTYSTCVRTVLIAQAR